MEELEITIDGLLKDQQDLQNKVIGFSQYGRYPSDEDFIEIHSLLENWLQIKSQVECLQQLKSAIVSNFAQLESTNK